MAATAPRRRASSVTPFAARLLCTGCPSGAAQPRRNQEGQPQRPIPFVEPRAAPHRETFEVALQSAGHWSEFPGPGRPCSPALAPQSACHSAWLAVPVGLAWGEAVAWPRWRRECPSLRHLGSSAGAAEDGGAQAELQYQRLADATLHRLHEQLDLVVDKAEDDAFDCDMSDGVITLRLGPHGVFVLNKQAPNRQLWLSSPVSGPARFEWSAQDRAWNNARAHEVELFALLQTELRSLLGQDDINLFPHDE